ncbi:MAG: MBL fold metallo-hydrolase [Desulfobacterales bacterium]|nr:MBL fold metallo-hydrolase [Desulfobacterales bacterium]
MSAVQEAAPGIYKIVQSVSRFKFSLNIYVIAGENGLVFDSGFGLRKMGRALVEQIREIEALERAKGLPCRITRVMASHGHWDHFSGLAFLQEALGLDVLATDKQAGRFTSKSDYKHFFWEEQALFDADLDPGHHSRKNPWRRMRNAAVNELLIRLCRIRFVSGDVVPVREGQVLSVGPASWEIIPVPGHCDDDIALFNRRTGVLLGGDLVLRKITTWLGPTKSDLDLYLNSLERVGQLPGLKLILPAHGSPITDPKGRIRKAIAHRHHRIDQIRNSIEEAGNLSFDEIYRRFYPKNALQRSLLGGWIVITLRYLLDRGEIRVEQKGGKPHFRAAS